MCAPELPSARCRPPIPTTNSDDTFTEVDTIVQPWYKLIPVVLIALPPSAGGCPPAFSLPGVMEMRELSIFVDESGEKPPHTTIAVHDHAQRRRRDEKTTTRKRRLRRWCIREERQGHRYRMFEVNHFSEDQSLSPSRQPTRPVHCVTRQSRG